MTRRWLFTSPRAVTASGRRCQRDDCLLSIMLDERMVTTNAARYSGGVRRGGRRTSAGRPANRLASGRRGAWSWRNAARGTLRPCWRRHGPRPKAMSMKTVQQPFARVVMRSFFDAGICFTISRVVRACGEPSCHPVQILLSPSADIAVVAVCSLCRGCATCVQQACRKVIRKNQLIFFPDLSWCKQANLEALPRDVPSYLSAAVGPSTTASPRRFCSVCGNLST